MRVQRNKDEGSIFLELLFGLSAASIILVALINIVSLGSKVYKKSQRDDDLFFEIEYALSYIEKEIKKAEEIYYLEAGRYPLIFFKRVDNDRIFYTYTLNNKNEIKRMARESKIEANYKDLKDLYLRGDNPLIERVNRFDMKAYDNYIDINVDVEDIKGQRSINKKVYFTCKIKELRE